MLHVVKLLVERQTLIIYVKVECFCFIRVSDYTLVFDMVFVSVGFGRYSVRNVVAGYRRILRYGFVSV